MRDLWTQTEGQHGLCGQTRQMPSVQCRANSAQFECASGVEQPARVSIVPGRLPWHAQLAAERIPLARDGPERRRLLVVTGEQRISHGRCRQSRTNISCSYIPRIQLSGAQLPKSGRVAHVERHADATLGADGACRANL